MKNLSNQIIELKGLIKYCEILNPGISSSPAGWHIEHILLTIDAVIANLKNSNPADYAPKFSWLKTIIFLSKKIPRGRAKAPKIVQPKTSISSDALNVHLLATKAAAESLSNLHPTNFFDHPAFGKLHLKKSITFLRIHTEHHLKIVRDILK